VRGNDIDVAILNPASRKLSKLTFATGEGVDRTR
jgi:hypothetical protein